MTTLEVVPGLVWDDLRFPSQGINPVGLAAPATLDQYGGLSFSGTVDNAIAGVAQLPHAWKPASIVRPHIHLRFPTANAGKNTRWRFDYDIASVNGDFTNNHGTLTTLATITVANPNNVKKHVIGSFGDLSMSGFKESCIIHWMVFRLANSDAADDDTNAAVLLEFDIHWQRVKGGTVAEYPS